MQLTGLHHVTAVSAKIADNVNFYTQVLGLRLVKKSVNQDDVSAYHLFYADKLGSPGRHRQYCRYLFPCQKPRSLRLLVQTIPAESSYTRRDPKLRWTPATALRRSRRPTTLSG
jgi:glyoxalase family protein